MTFDMQTLLELMNLMNLSTIHLYRHYPLSKTNCGVVYISLQFPGRNASEKTLAELGSRTPLTYFVHPELN